MHVWYVYMHKHIYVSKPICCKYGSLVNTYLHIWHTLKIHIYFKMVQKKDMICLLSYRWSTAAADCRNLPSVSTLFECPEVEGHFIHWLPTSKKHSVAFPRERSQCRRSISQPEQGGRVGFFLDTKSHIFWSPKLKGFLKAWVWECSGHVEAEG